MTGSSMMKALLHILLLSFTLWAGAQTLNRGIGQYPGNPDEYFGPIITTVAGDAAGYRNLALNRTVRQSSSWDFNLTAQLLTDGIIDRQMPAWLEVTTPAGPLPPNKREACIDGNEWTSNRIDGNTLQQWLWHSMEITADEIEVVGSVAYREELATEGFCINLSVANSTGGNPGTGHQNLIKRESRWNGDTLPGYAAGRVTHSDPNKRVEETLPVRRFAHTFSVDRTPFDNLTLNFNMPGAVYWDITEVRYRRDGQTLNDILPSRHFHSAWRSLGNSHEWVSIDLGGQARVEQLRLYWVGQSVDGNVELSDDATHWTNAGSWKAHPNEGLYQKISINSARGRYVRLNFDGQPMLTEVEVMGSGGVVVSPCKGQGWKDGKWMLNGGDWTLERDGTANRIAATVPATVLSSYVNAGALPDMNHDDNLMLASESFFNGDFTYNRTFDLPEEMRGNRVWLNFDGINWKADVWLNDAHVGRIEGAFKRGRFDITQHMKSQGNQLRVCVHANAHPGGVKVKTEKNTDFNGGILGADNPTFHATAGWDWISTIRGRDSGIWDDVYLTGTGDVTVSDPVVTTTLGENDTLATITPAVMLTNHSDHEVIGTLSGHIGLIKFDKQVTLAAGATVEESFSPGEYSQLNRQRLRLWWPNGYGEPYLHEAGFTFTVNGKTSDQIAFKAGIREVKTVDKDTNLRIYINHRRLIPKGGNWAFSENNLNYRGREFDAAVRHHREMNCNMIRNWVGMTGDKEFFEACDRHGIMVWQDFWLANPADGPDPTDEAMFMDNARDFVFKIRNHPCIGVYCGRNEGYPPQTLDHGLRNTVAALHPGLDYISSSADGGVTGHGPYHALTATEYFERQTGKLHTERGMPCVMTIEGLSRTLDAAHLWPQNLYWGRHDYTMEGAQRGASFNELVAESFGEPTSATEFCEWAQWVNYEGYRAMYESGNKTGAGLLIWMSHPCWPSMVWQTYDYYLEPTAAYFGVKHACESLHAQWNPVSREVEVINHSAGKQTGVATASIYRLDGRLLWQEKKPYHLNDDEHVDAMRVELPHDAEGVYILRLTLTDREGRQASLNDYVQSARGNDRTALHDLRRVNVDAVTAANGKVTISNNGPVAAMMLRLNLKGDDGQQILPAIYSDNYFHLLPGESRTIDVEWNAGDTRGTRPVIEITGMNVTKTVIEL